MRRSICRHSFCTEEASLTQRVRSAGFKARERIGDRDEDDWPVLATALALACDIWTEDAGFFGAGIAVWTTSRIEIFFRQQMKVIRPE